MAGEGFNFMIEEKEKRKFQAEGHKIGGKEGRSKKTVFLVRVGRRKAALVVPEGVRVRAMDDPEEVEPVGEGVYEVGPGKFFAKDPKTGEKTEIEFSPNSDCLDKAT